MLKIQTEKNYEEMIEELNQVAEDFNAGKMQLEEAMLSEIYEVDFSDDEDEDDKWRSSAEQECDLSEHLGAEDDEELDDAIINMMESAE